MRHLAFFALALLPAACQPLTLDPFLYDPVPAPAGGYKLSTRVIPRHQDFFVDTPDGERLHLAFVPRAPGNTRPLTIVYFHGQGHNIGGSWPRVEYLYPLGHDIYVVDPRGYGRSTGTPSESGIQTDLVAVHDFLVLIRGLSPTRLVYYGRSLGGALAIHLADAGAPAALITESAFTSVAALVRDGVHADLPARFVSGSVWDNLGKIQGIRSPYLIFHGTADPYVKYSYAEELAAAHPGDHQLVTVEGADHGNVPDVLNLLIYRDAITRFLLINVP